MFRQILTFTLIISTLSIASAALSCLDREASYVPWFTFIKFPGNITNGSGRYAYLDPHLNSSEYHIINGSYVDTLGEALPNTIAGINAVPKEHLNLMVFNDQPPDQLWDPYGAHAKGILAFDNETQTGVYIMHSFPKFPSVSVDGIISHILPNNTNKYGQNAYCISLNADNLPDILANLAVEWPHVYYASGMFKEKVFKSPVNYTVSNFALLDGEDQWFLTKNPNYTGFLYEDVIQSYFETSLAVQSWGRPYQAPICQSNTSTHRSINIVQIAFNEKDTWDHFSDHSKWAITLEDNSLNMACFCDMNRMDSQLVRGGSCFCSKNAVLYNALRKIIVVTDKCEVDQVLIQS